MIATHNQHTQKNELMPEACPPSPKDINIKPIKHLTSFSRLVTHTSKAGLNPIVDAAAYLFSVLGNLKTLKSYSQLNKLQKELIHEINAFQDVIKSRGCNPEYGTVCSYIICATFDDIISNTEWGNQGQWEKFSLLASFNQQDMQQEKFFTIMERAIKEPTFYIDLMELMYICLSMGYKGQYRSSDQGQYQLEQISHNLYKHIRAYRGSFSKLLSPTPLRIQKLAAEVTPKKNTSAVFIFFVTACIIMTIFISLGYLMDVISNEAYKNISQIEKSVSHETLKQ